MPVRIGTGLSTSPDQRAGALEAAHEALDPAALVGCAAGGVIAARREVEDGTAVSVWAAHLDGGTATPFHAMVEELEEGTGALAGMAELDGDEGAVGVRLDGVELLPSVSQGAPPIGPELTITAADGHVILELAGRPALEKLREAIEALPASDLALVQGGLL